MTASTNPSFQGDGTSFVVLATQRSGSTWLMSVLNGLSGVSAQGELFLPRQRSSERRWDSDFAYPRFVELETKRRRPFSTFEYLDDFFATSPSAGFKLMYSQLKVFPEILPYLIRKRIPIVHLVRTNHLDVLISFAVKHRLGQAHVLTGDRPADVRVDLETSTLLADLRHLEFKYRVARTMLRACRLRHLEAAYEDLVADPDAFARVLEFLDLPTSDEPPSSNIVRSRQGTQRDAVANFHDVAAVLEGTRFAHLLDYNAAASRRSPSGSPPAGGSSQIDRSR
jgi:LPS sulfotransferase NodH